MSELENIIGRSIDVLGIIEQLTFDDANVALANLNQGKLYLDASTLYVQVLRSCADQKAEVSRLRSALSLSIRKNAAASGEKITEGGIEARLSVSPKVRAAEALLRSLEQQQEFVRLLLEAMKMRRDAIKNLSEINASEFPVLRGAVDTQTKVKDIKRKLGERFAGEG